MTSENLTNTTANTTPRFYPKVNARIIAPFMLASITIAMIGIFIVTRQVAGSIQERFTSQLLDSADSAVNTIADIEREQLAALRAMVFTEGVAASIEAGSTEDLDDALRVIAANNTLQYLLVYDLQGEVLLYLERNDTDAQVEYNTPPPPDILDWPGVARVRSGLADVLGDKFVDVITDANGETRFYFSAPVVTSANQRVGGVTIGMDADDLAQRVGEQSLSAVTFIAEEGVVLSSTFRVGQDRLMLDLSDMQVYNAQVAAGETPISKVTFNEVPYQVLYTDFTLRGQTIGLMSVGLRSTVLDERVGESRLRLGLVFVGLFVFVTFSGLVVGRTIIGPIERLVSTTRAIRDGDLTRRVQLQMPDELGELGASFDTMTEQLVNRNQQIETLYNQQVEITVQREAVLTSISDAVIVQDVEGNVILHNRTAERIMQGVQDNAEEDRNFRALCTQPQLLREPRIVSLIDYHFSVLATPVEVETGETIGYVIVFRDITAIIESEKIKDDLVLQMSHELRTPLSAVIGFIDLVRMLDADKLSTTSQEYIGKASTHLTTLERLVNQVVDVSEMIAERFDIHPGPFDLIPLIERSFEKWRQQMAARNHQLLLAVSIESLELDADEERLRQVLDHLLRNAHNYTLPGGLIELRVEANLDWVMIAVSDNGVGIQEHELQKVFQRMYRGRSAEAGPTDARGMGMGLYITREIIEAHHGFVRINSEPGKGTSVAAYLPIKQPE